MDILATTKMYKNYQLAIPKSVRDQLNEFDINNIVLDWAVNENKDIIIKLREKKILKI